MILGEWRGLWKAAQKLRRSDSIRKQIEKAAKFPDLDYAVRLWKKKRDNNQV